MTIDLTSHAPHDLAVAPPSTAEARGRVAPPPHRAEPSELDRAETAPLPILPGYLVEERIRWSHNAHVYRARREADGARVVLKLLSAEYPNPRQLSRFVREYEIARRVLVDGKPLALAQESMGRSLVLVLTDVSGQPLDRVLESGPLKLEAFLPLAIQIAQRLGELHREHIIHKDINPSNILVGDGAAKAHIIDFGIATVLSRESLAVQNANGLDGTLAYVAPEQTGRTGCLVDSRADLYSLGVTFYEMLAGRPPFTGKDALELVHCHLAMEAPPLEVIADTPAPRAREAIAAVVRKLMAKRPEDRYQSVQGLKADLSLLEQTLSGSASPQALLGFTPGRHDVIDRFELPQRLYGRDRERAQMFAAFEEVKKGRSELLLVAGYSGIGKSSLVHELSEPITAARGHFVSGKFDQRGGDEPYAALVQALRGLCRYLLAEADGALERWRELLLGAVGGSGQLLVELVPEAEWLLGPQPPLPDLGPNEARNHFYRTVANFLGAVSGPEHPIVLFLDDMQWADADTLRLVSALAEGDLPGLLIILAYRDNEVGATHPLTMTLEALERAGKHLHRVRLAPLSREHIAHWLGEALRADAKAVTALAEVLVRKTDGNPFFIGQFLQSLYREGSLAFDHEAGRWRWDEAAIERKALTDNVITFLAQRIGELPAASQRLLELAACIGHSFDWPTLEVIAGLSPPQLEEAILPAVREGFILTEADPESPARHERLIGERGRFLHDRIQQAAYRSIPEDQRVAVHLQIARLLQASAKAERTAAGAFAIASHFNQAAALITAPEERAAAAQLNLLAGQRAMASRTFEQAYRYFTAGLTFLGEGAWSSDYTAALNLTIGAAEAACFNLDAEAMHPLVEAVIANARDALDQVRAHVLQIFYHHSAAQFSDALVAAVRCLAHLGEPLPEVPTTEAFLQTLGETMRLLDEKGMERLEHLPPMQDARVLAAMTVLRRSLPPAYFCQSPLLGFIICGLVKLTVLHGDCPLTPYAFACLSVLFNGALGDFSAGERYGELALRIFERRADRRYQALAYNFYYGLSRPFYRPVREGLEPLLQGYLTLSESGDIEVCTYCLVNSFFQSILAGESLDRICERYVPHIEDVAGYKQEQVIHQLNVWLQAIKNLQGRSTFQAELRGDVVDIVELVPRLEQERNLNTLNYADAAQAMLACVFGDFELAARHAQAAAPRMGASTGKYFTVARNFYHSLSLAALHASKGPAEREAYLATIADNQRQMERWAESCPQNFRHFHLLIEAETARIGGRLGEAASLYEDAIADAAQNGFVHDEALAAERAALFWSARGRERLARAYLEHARHTYLHWGAVAKVRQMDAAYPNLLSPFRPPALNGAGTASSASRSITATASGSVDLSIYNLDLGTLLKAFQAISSEIVLDRLLARLLQIVIENAGAQRGCLFLTRDGQLCMEAEASVTTGEFTVVQSPDLAEPGKRACLPMVQWTARTRQSLILDDAASDATFAGDAYVVEHGLRSVLCAPVLKNRELIGVVYLENNFAPRVFTADRLALVSMLAAQAAISLENARIFDQIDRMVKERTRQLEEAQQSVVKTAHKAGMAEVAANVLHNVGNVLNSVNVGVEQVSERIGANENLTRLKRIAGLLAQHADRLGEFVATDQGRMLPQYLTAISDRMEAEQRELGAELAGVYERLGHIKTTIAIQQRYASDTRLVEELDPSVLIEEALGITVGSTECHDIEVRREIEPLPRIMIDRHRTQVILVNLIVNAIDAVRASLVQPKLITVRLRRRGAAEVCLEVADNGVGIRPEDLGRVFQYGFTNKKEGHGFGLHASANAAVEMGGALTVRSDGPGTGATFTLVLPLSPRAATA